MKRPAELNTIWIFILSLALGVIIWADGVREADPLETEQFTLPIEVVRKPDAVVLNELPTAVRINVEAPSTEINELKQLEESIFRAFIDLNQVDFDDDAVNINIDWDEVSYPRVSVPSHFPKEASLEMDQQVEKKIPIIVDVRGSAAQGFELGQASIDPVEVTISGPSSRVNPIVEARTDVFLDIPLDTVTRNRPLSFYDSRDNLVLLNTAPIVNTTRNSVQVTIPVNKLPGYQTVVVRGDNLVGSPNENFFLSNVEVEPKTITVNGPDELIKDLVSVETEPIPIEGLRASQSFDVDVILPEGVERVGQTTIEVDVDIQPRTETRSFTLTPQLVGLIEAEFEPRIEQSAVDVVLFGSREVLNAISLGEISATLDLSGLESGVHDVDVAVDVPIQDVEVRSVQPEVLAVELVALEPTATPTEIPTVTPTRTPRRSRTPTSTPDPDATETVEPTETPTEES